MKFIFGFVCALAVLASISFATDERAFGIKGQTYRTIFNITQTYASGEAIPVSVVCPDWANVVANSCSGSTSVPFGYQGKPRSPTMSLIGKNCTATFAGYDATATEAGFVYAPGVSVFAQMRCLNITA